MPTCDESDGVVAGSPSSGAGGQPRPSSYQPETYGSLKEKLSYCANSLFLGRAYNGSYPIVNGVKVSGVGRPAEHMLFLEHNGGLNTSPP